MDIIISRLVESKTHAINTLKNKAIGNEFKQCAAQAITLTEMSGPLYNRLARTYRANVSDADKKRVKAGRLTTDGTSLTGSGNGRKVLSSLEQARRTGSRGLPANLSRTASDVAVASNAPQANNILTLLQTSILSKDPLKAWDSILSTANVLGVVATTAGYLTTGGASAAINAVAAGATYVGGTSMLKPSAPDFAFHALKNYAACVNAWNLKAGALIEIADPNGQWSYRDFH